MRYIADHDFHIHSTCSPCCSDPMQTPETILNYAKENGFRKVCLTNHFWDEDVWSPNTWHPDEKFSFISQVLPLPQAEGIDFLFGAEADMDYNFTVGISEKRFENFDFIVVSTTHLQIEGYTVKKTIETPEEAAEIWLARLNTLLENDFPWHKMGIAHLTTGHIFEGGALPVVKLLKDEDLYSVFGKCAKKGVGIELNIKTLGLSSDEKNALLHPFAVAKDCGCKFYMGSDSHNTSALKTVKENFEDVITALNLKESDKLPFLLG